MVNNDLTQQKMPNTISSSNASGGASAPRARFIPYSRGPLTFRNRWFLNVKSSTILMFIVNLDVWDVQKCIDWTLMASWFLVIEDWMAQLYKLAHRRFVVLTHLAWFILPIVTLYYLQNIPKYSWQYLKQSKSFFFFCLVSPQCQEYIQISLMFSFLLSGSCKYA